MKSWRVIYLGLLILRLNLSVVVLNGSWVFLSWFA